MCIYDRIVRTVTSGLIDFCIMLRRLRQIRLRHMVTPHTVTSVTPPVTPNSVTQQGYHHPMRVMVTSRHSLVTPPRHSPLHSPTSLFASLLASLPRHSTASLPATPSRHTRVTPSRHSPRHSPRHFPRHSSGHSRVTPRITPPRHSPRHSSRHSHVTPPRHSLVTPSSLLA